MGHNHHSGDIRTHGNTDVSGVDSRMVDIIRKEALNPHASIVWHETWAYAANSSHGMFKLYDNDQERMYSIVACVRRASQNLTLPVVIPCGDAIQIARGPAWTIRMMSWYTGSINT